MGLTMRRTIALLAAGTLLVPAIAGATAETGSDTAQKAVPITGNVSAHCVLGDPNPSTVALNALEDPTTGKLRSIGDQNVSLPASWCNYAGTQVSISSSALLADTPTAPSGFSRAVNFTSTVSTWGANPQASATTAASSTGGSPNASGTGQTLCQPNQTDLSLVLSDFSTAGGANNILVASGGGGYSGTVTITLGPGASCSSPD
jgi:hypothetical protein